MNFRMHDKPRRVVRDFHRPRYGNPMFPRSGARQQRRPNRPANPWTLRLTAGAFGIAALWYALWSPAFTITTVTVTGVSPAAEDAIRAGIAQHEKGSTLFVFPNANALVFDQAGALKDISSKVILDRITLRKKLPHTIVVEAAEKIGRAALDEGGRLFALDESGVIVRELSESELNQLAELPPSMDAVQVAGLGAESVPVAGTTTAAPAALPAEKAPQQGTVPLVMLESLEAGKDARSTAPGTAIIPTAAMRIVLQAHARLSDIAGARVRWYVVRAASETVEAVMEGDWRVLMSSALPFDAQGERLALVLKEKIGARKPKLEYVDLRYNERIFFRMKGETSP